MFDMVAADCHILNTTGGTVLNADGRSHAVLCEFVPRWGSIHGQHRTVLDWI